MKIFKKENEVVELAMEYLEASEKCVKTAEKAVFDYLSGDLRSAEELQKRVRFLESEADDLRRSIGDKLYSGAFLPLMRGDIYSLIESIDRVPNAAEACSTFFMGEKPAIPDQFKAPLQEITAESFGVMKELSKAIKGFFKPKGKTEMIREHAKQVGIQESVVDEKEWNLTLAIFGDSSLELGAKLHLKKALDRIVHISDRAEDSAEALGLVAVKSVN